MAQVKIEKTTSVEGQPSWTGVGVKVDRDLTVDELMEVAKLDWPVSKRALWYSEKAEEVKSPNQTKLIQAKSVYAITRDDTNAMLGPCGPKYIPTQNKDAFSFFDKFIKEGKMELSVVGNIDSGRHVWAQAKLNEGFTLPGGDRVEGYMLLSHPHIWGKSLTIMFTPIRIVCQNTLNYVLNGNSDRFRFVHNQTFGEDVKKMAEIALGISKDQLKVYEERAIMLSQKKIKKVDLQKYFVKLFQPQLLKDLADNDNLDEQEFNRTVTKLLDIYDKQPGYEMSKDTWWTAFNTVTYFSDHLAGNTVDSRLKSAWFGHQANVKRRALQLALKSAA